jgi:hypothetical protein
VVGFLINSRFQCILQTGEKNTLVYLEPTLEESQDSLKVYIKFSKYSLGQFFEIFILFIAGFLGAKSMDEYMFTDLIGSVLTGRDLILIGGMLM